MSSAHFGSTSPLRHLYKSGYQNKGSAHIEDVFVGRHLHVVHRPAEILPGLAPDRRRYPLPASVPHLVEPVVHKVLPILEHLNPLLLPPP